MNKYELTTETLQFAGRTKVEKLSYGKYDGK